MIYLHVLTVPREIALLMTLRFIVKGYTELQHSLQTYMTHIGKWVKHNRFTANVEKIGGQWSYRHVAEAAMCTRYWLIY